MFPAIFLDRDGVIIENRPNYVRRWEEVEFFPQALAALARLKSSDHKIVVVTNQAGVGRGLIPMAVAEEINRRFWQAVEAAGGRIDGIYVCPHRPEDLCTCRKPRPGLLIRAAQELDIDLGRSVMVGDALTDLLAGQAAGVHQVALVRTGRGAQQAREAWPDGLRPFPIYATLAEALAELAPDP